MPLRLLPAVVACLCAVGLSSATRQSSGFDPGSLEGAIRPQDDLYRHVNADWLARTAVPPERVTYGTFGELAEAVDADLLALVQDLRAGPPARAGSPARKIADMYASVTDEATLAAQGAAPMRAQLRRIDRIRTIRDMAAEAGALSALAAGGPFHGAMASDPEDPSRLIVQIAQGGTLLPERDLYVRTDAYAVEVRTRYVAYLATLFRLLEREEAEGEARAVLALETELARAQWVRADSRDPVKTANRYTFRELARDMPGFDWDAWGRPQGLTAGGSVVLAQPSFFTAFAALVPVTPLETWQAWLRARYVTAVASYVSDPFGDARFEFFGRFLTGQEVPRRRWRRGVALAGGYLPDAVGRLYVERHFPRASKARVERIAAHVRAAFHEAIGGAAWLSPPAAREARRKLSRLRIRVGYPEGWRDYRDLVVKPDDLLGNVQRAQHFENQQALVRTTRGDDPRHWPVPAHSVNAAYSPATNEIVLPAGLLRPPIFDAGADDAVNYGAIGGIIGHELSHAFDARGRHFDAGGARRDWWTPADARAFVGLAVRLVEQANAWPPFDGTPIDGTFTFAENAADLAGLSIAYRAYRQSLGGRRSAVIDGLTGEQRFFIGWARAWRATVRPEYVRQMLLTDPHAPAVFRVNGLVQHIDGFHEAFGVRPGDRLYRRPEDRVRIW